MKARNQPDHSDQPEIGRGDRLVLYATVSITGAAVMMLELLGTRIIGPFYGVSLYVWSSLISVALIALSLGYYLGGLLADRTRFRLSHTIALAALSSAIIPFASAPVLSAMNVLGVRGGSFSSALILFTVPLTFLGMVGPHVIKLSTRRLDSVGLASGSVYAVSTIGSVVGTLLLGFFLLPVVGTKAIFYGVSLVLLVLAVAFALFERRRLGVLASLKALLVMAVLSVFALFADSKTSGSLSRKVEILYEAESAYGWVRVIEDYSRGMRWLLSDSSTISAMRLDTKEVFYPYLWILESLPYFHPEGRQALLIGLGGGYIAMSLKQHNGIVTDSIEIDPEVARAAQEHFGFDPPGALIVGDARYEIRRLDKTYDFIIHDCFTGGAVPAHLLSMEMLRDLRSKLGEKGILALNFYGFARGENAAAMAAVYRTIGEVFPHRRAFMAFPERKFSDVVMLASMEPLEIDPDAAANKPRLLERLSRHEQEIPPESGFVITDDYNPLESMQVRKAEAYRERLLTWIGSDLLIR